MSRRGRLSGMLSGKLRAATRELITPRDVGNRVSLLIALNLVLDWFAYRRSQDLSLNVFFCFFFLRDYSVRST